MYIYNLYMDIYIHNIYIYACVCLYIVSWGIYLILKLLDVTVVLNWVLHPQ